MRISLWFGMAVLCSVGLLAKHDRLKLFDQPITLFAEAPQPSQIAAACAMFDRYSIEYMLLFHPDMVLLLDENRRQTVKSLNLAGFDLSSLSGHSIAVFALALSTLSKVNFLDLTDVDLANVHGTAMVWFSWALSSLSNLEFLMLGDNDFSEFDYDDLITFAVAFKHLKKLAHLGLINTQFVRLDVERMSIFAAIFTTSRQLWHVKLSGNDLRLLTHDTALVLTSALLGMSFYGHTGLHWLDLSNTSFEQLDKPVRRLFDLVLDTISHESSTHVLW